MNEIKTLIQNISGRGETVDTSVLEADGRIARGGANPSVHTIASVLIIT